MSLLVIVARFEAGFFADKNFIPVSEIAARIHISTLQTLLEMCNSIQVIRSTLDSNTLGAVSPYPTITVSSLSVVTLGRQPSTGRSIRL
ncbi:hypothetical protein TNCV_4972931 [Trichonephila clavipes]|nr:hypothetical protein TNCV_4972931 [Trichonephila clavipes]